MNENEQKPAVPIAAIVETSKKIYTVPSVKVYGNVSELVQASNQIGRDSGSTDDGTGS